MRIFLSYCFTSIIFLMVSCSESKETKKEINTEPSESVEHAVAEESTATNEHSLVNRGRKNIQIIRSDEDISLKDFENTTHLYGLGVEKGLKGEIQVFDGKLEISRRSDETILMDYSFNNTAEFFLHTTVENWQQIDIPPMVKSQGQFQIFLRQEAKKAGIDMTKPFPFLLSGYIQKLNWHIVNYDPSISIHTPEDPLKSGISGVIANGDVEILGFYATDSKEILADKGEKIHMHFRTDQANIAGHVNGIFLGPYMTLSLPRN